MEAEGEQRTNSNGNESSESPPRSSVEAAQTSSSSAGAMSQRILTDDIYDYVPVFVDITKVLKTENVVRYTRNDHTMVRKFVELFRRRRYGYSGHYISVAIPGMTQETTNAIINAVLDEPLDEPLEPCHITELPGLSKKAALEVKSLKVVYVDGMHRGAALMDESVRKVTPYPRAHLYYRNDNRPMSDLDVLSIGCTFNQAGSHNIAMSVSDRVCAMVSVIRSLTSIRAKGSLAMPAFPGNERDLVFDPQGLDVNTISTLCRGRNINVDMSDRQARKYCQIALGIVKLQEDPKVIISSLSKVPNINLISGSNVWQAESMNKQLFVLRGIGLLFVNQSFKRDSRGRMVKDNVRTEANGNAVALLLGDLWDGLANYADGETITMDELMGTRVRRNIRAPIPDLIPFCEKVDEFLGKVEVESLLSRDGARKWIEVQTRLLNIAKKGRRESVERASATSSRARVGQEPDQTSQVDCPPTMLSPNPVPNYISTPSPPVSRPLEQTPTPLSHPITAPELQQHFEEDENNTESDKGSSDNHDSQDRSSLSSPPRRKKKKSLATPFRSVHVEKSLKKKSPASPIRRSARVAGMRKKPIPQLSDDEFSDDSDRENPEKSTSELENVTSEEAELNPLKLDLSVFRTQDNEVSDKEDEEGFRVTHRWGEGFIYKAGTPRWEGSLSHEQERATTSSDDPGCLPWWSITIKNMDGASQKLRLFEDRELPYTKLNPSWKLDYRSFRGSPEQIHVSSPPQWSMEIDLETVQEPSTQLLLQSLGLRPCHRSFFLLNAKEFFEIRRFVQWRLLRDSEAFAEAFSVMSEEDTVTQGLVSMIGELFRTKLQGLRTKLDATGYVVFNGILKKDDEETSQRSGWGNMFSDVVNLTFPSDLQHFLQFFEDHIPSERQFAANDFTDKQRLIWRSIRQTPEEHSGGVCPVSRLTTSLPAMTTLLEHHFGDVGENLLRTRVKLDVLLMMLCKFLRLEAASYTAEVDDNTPRLKCPDTGGRLIMMLPGTKYQGPHRDNHVPDSIELKPDGSAVYPPYFAMTSGEHPTPLWIAEGTHKWVGKRTGVLRELGPHTNLKLAYIPPHSVYIVNGFMYHAGAGGRESLGKHCSRYHLYILRDGIPLADGFDDGTMFNVEEKDIEEDWEKLLVTM